LNWQTVEVLLKGVLSFALIYAHAHTHTCLNNFNSLLIHPIILTGFKKDILHFKM